jgi:protein-L-isoaspartate(D-aspartate) O-methyltransferase
MNLAARKIRLIMHLRASGITDTRTLSAIERVPRELFVPEPFRDQAYENRALPIGHGQTLSQPEVVAIMTQALAVGPRHKVLEIGTGSGYQCAVLARLARRVYTIERHKPLLAEAEARFAQLRLPNITTRCGDGSRGWPEQAPFDRIIITAAAPEMPYALIGQLTEGGILVAPIGPDRGDQELYRITRTAGGETRDWLCSVRFVPLIAGAAPATSPGETVTARSASLTASRTRK